MLNYEKIAERIASRYFDEDSPNTHDHLKKQIVVALQSAANDAAWDMHRMKCNCERAAILYMFGEVEALEAEMVAKYGPQPELDKQ